ncbi:MAG: DNA polymerase III subunit delta [Candidatus Moraniibacteriota bacterium]|nr:MAG: DNA polymerase III subunit delta [Candidatus Moranbacteria bacterium]
MLVFLYGPDAYRSQEKQLLFQERFLSEGGSSSGIRHIDVEEWNEEDVISKFKTILTTRDLFNVKTCICIRGFFSLPKNNRDALADFFAKEYNDNEERMIIIRETAVNKVFRIFKILKKKAALAEEFFLLKEKDLTLWAKQYCSKQYPDFRFEEDALLYILKQSMGDLFRFIHEVEKLSLICDEKKYITKEDTNRYIARTPSSAIFDLLDSLGSGNRGLSFDLLSEQYDQEIPPEQIFAMLFYHVNNCARIISLYEEENIHNYYEIASKARVHPYVAQKTIQGRSKISLQRAKSMIQILARFDRAIKSGKIHVKAAIEEFISRA